MDSPINLAYLEQTNAETNQTLGKDNSNPNGQIDRSKQITIEIEPNEENTTRTIRNRLFPTDEEKKRQREKLIQTQNEITTLEDPSYSQSSIGDKFYREHGHVPLSIVNLKELVKEIQNLRILNFRNPLSDKEIFQALVELNLSDKQASHLTAIDLFRLLELRTFYTPLARPNRAPITGNIQEETVIVHAAADSSDHRVDPNNTTVQETSRN